jgi:hypothetical protein
MHEPSWVRQGEPAWLNVLERHPSTPTLRLAAARSDLRDLLLMLRDGLGQPPLSAKFRLTMETLLDLLGEQDLGKRLAPPSTSRPTSPTPGAGSSTRCQRPPSPGRAAGLPRVYSPQTGLAMQRRSSRSSLPPRRSVPTAAAQPPLGL